MVVAVGSIPQNGQLDRLTVLCLLSVSLFGILPTADAHLLKLPLGGIQNVVSFPFYDRILVWIFLLLSLLNSKKG